MRAQLTLAAVLVMGLLLGGCGGGGDETGTAGNPPATAGHKQNPPKVAVGPGKKADNATGSSGGVEAQLSPDAKVDLAIKGVLASAAPELACRRYATLSYVKQTFGSRVGCVQSTVPASAAEFVEVTKIEISGDEAKAKAVPTGGPSDGETIEVKLVRQGGIWKVDSLRSNAPVGP